MTSACNRVAYVLTIGALILAQSDVTLAGGSERPALQRPAVVEPSRISVGIGLIISEPKEEFDENVGVGFGVGGAVHYHVDRSGWFSLRFDGGWLQYGHETKVVPFSTTVGARILLDVSTSNTIINLGAGPELAVPHGPVRPYIHTGFSGLLFRTTSSVSGFGSTDEPIATTTNLSDWTSAWVVGAGVRIPLGGSLVDLDLGARYHRGGEALYLREGSIIDHPDGSITINALRSRTPFMVYAVGVKIRIPGSSD